MAARFVSTLTAGENLTQQLGALGVMHHAITTMLTATALQQDGRAGAAFCCSFVCLCTTLSRPGSLSILTPLRKQRQILGDRQVVQHRGCLPHVARALLFLTRTWRSFIEAVQKIPGQTWWRGDINRCGHFGRPNSSVHSEACSAAVFLSSPGSCTQTMCKLHPHACTCVTDTTTGRSGV